jgi:hypothetical protein
MEQNELFSDGRFIFKIRSDVLLKDSQRWYLCGVLSLHDSRHIGNSYELENTIKNMRKLTPLEKELM